MMRDYVGEAIARGDEAMSSLFPEPVASQPVEVYPFNLDTAIRAFLNRWMPRVLNAEHRSTIEAELRALIQDAKEHA